MLPTYFKRETTLTAYYNSPSGPYLDQFTDWLSLLVEMEELKESNRGLEEEVEDLTHKLSK